MLIEFRVENHRSLRDEQALTLEAGRGGDSFDPRPRSVAGHNESLLPAAVIYGANASGKTNVLAALAFMREAVIDSHRRWEPEGGVPRTAFAWGSSRNETSLFEVTVLLGDVKQAYGFCLDDDAVREEWLFAWPNKRKQVLFEREGEQYKFGEHLKGPNDLVREITRPNALFLSAAAQHGHKGLTPFYSWVREILPVNLPSRWHPGFMTRRVLEELPSPSDEQGSPVPNEVSEKAWEDRIRKLLRAADIGIVGLRREDIEFKSGGNSLSRGIIWLQHLSGDENSWLDLEEESAGTKTLFRMAPSIFRALDRGGLLLIDELESSLHPLLGLAIVKMFNCPGSNPRNAQIVFTTHDTNLLGTTLGDVPLRRDQVWFTEKNEEGATTLYPLTDFKPRKSENLERGYLQGRYGAIPFLGDATWITA